MESLWRLARLSASGTKSASAKASTCETVLRFRAPRASLVTRALLRARSVQSVHFPKWEQPLAMSAKLGSTKVDLSHVARANPAHSR